MEVTCVPRAKVLVLYAIVETIPLKKKKIGGKHVRK